MARAPDAPRRLARRTPARMHREAHDTPTTHRFRVLVEFCSSPKLAEATRSTRTRSRSKPQPNSDIETRPVLGEPTTDLPDTKAQILKAAQCWLAGPLRSLIQPRQSWFELGSTLVELDQSKVKAIPNRAEDTLMPSRFWWKPAVVGGSCLS